MVDVYRSLVANLRDKLGGTINDANADAIARAAAQVYRREVEPRLWEEKSAHELLDSFGVPRAGPFTPYSLSDRLLLFHRRHGDDPHRAEAHELLDELGVPRLDEAGHLRPLEARLTLLLGSLDDVSAAVAAPNGADPGPREAAVADDGGEEDGPSPTSEAAGSSDGIEATVASPELVDALETIQRAVGPAGQEEATPDPAPASTAAPPGPPAAAAAAAPDLIGLGTVLGTMQEKLVEIERAVESLRQELRDAVALFQAGGGTVPVPAASDVVSPDAVPEVVIRRDGGSSEGAAPSVALSSGIGGSGAPDPVLETPGPAPVSPHEPTQVLPPVEDAPSDPPVLSEEAVTVEEVVPRRRTRRLVLLVVLILLIGMLLAAGITAAFVLGWDQLESRIVDLVAVPVWDGSSTASW